MDGWMAMEEWKVIHALMVIDRCTVMDGQMGDPVELTQQSTQGPKSSSGFES